MNNYKVSAAQGQIDTITAVTAEEAAKEYYNNLSPIDQAEYVHIDVTNCRTGETENFIFQQEKSPGIALGLLKYKIIRFCC